jgi:hypothetical protein
MWNRRLPVVNTAAPSVPHETVVPRCHPRLLREGSGWHTRTWRTRTCSGCCAIDLNARLLHCGAFLCGGHLQLEAFLPVESLMPGYLAAVCLELGRTADEVGSLMAAVHGGQVSFADETEEV